MRKNHQEERETHTWYWTGAAYKKIALLFSYWGIGRCFSVGGKMRTCFVEATSKCSAFLGTLNNQKIQLSDNLLCILYPYLTIVD